VLLGQRFGRRDVGERGLHLVLEAGNHLRLAAKDEFLATVSHELRTPLTAILGWSRMLADAHDVARFRRGVAIIQRNAHAQAKIIDDILDVSRIISGKLRLHLGRVDLRSIIDSVADSLRPAASAKEVTLSVEVDVSTPMIADEDRLHQIVWNLLSNAVKFTPAAGTVSERACRAARPGGGARGPRYRPRDRARRSS
jgi:signal transduction histidine kinase